MGTDSPVARRNPEIEGKWGLSVLLFETTCFAHGPSEAGKDDRMTTSPFLLRPTIEGKKTNEQEN